MDTIPSGSSDTPIKYSTICELIGHLYIRSTIGVKVEGEQYQSIVEGLSKKIGDLSNTNATLLREINSIKNKE